VCAHSAGSPAFTTRGCTGLRPWAVNGEESDDGARTSVQLRRASAESALKTFSDLQGESRRRTYAGPSGGPE
jgi:hypothetical protein